jgi:hypothetical protein
MFVVRILQRCRAYGAGTTAIDGTGDFAFLASFQSIWERKQSANSFTAFYSLWHRNYIGAILQG